jgi:hypothetical protein
VKKSITIAIVPMGATFTFVELLMRGSLRGFPAFRWPVAQKYAQPTQHQIDHDLDRARWIAARERQLVHRTELPAEKPGGNEEEDVADQLEPVCSADAVGKRTVALHPQSDDRKKQGQDQAATEAEDNW